MRYSTEPKYRKYVEVYGLLSYPRKFGDKNGKKLIYIATKTAIDAAKTASKRVVSKTVEPARDFIGNKIADKITSVDKRKSKEREDETNKIREIYIPSESTHQIIDGLRLL